MFEFLSTLFIFVFSLNSAVINSTASASNRIIPEFSVTFGTYTSEVKQQKNDEEQNNSNLINGEENALEKVTAYNTKSEKVIGDVSDTAVENSQALIESQPQNNVVIATPSPSPTPSVTPIPTTIPLPEPTEPPYRCPPPPPCQPYAVYSGGEKIIPEIYPCPLYPDGLSSSPDVICID